MININIIPNQITGGIIVEIVKLNLKILCGNTNNLIQMPKRLERLALPDLKVHYEATMMKICGTGKKI